MLKRNTDLFIKLLLFIFLIVLFVLILFEANKLEQPISLKVVEAAPTKTEITPILCTDIDGCSTVSEETLYLEKIKKWEEQYYYATNIWKYLRQRNFSQAATCGIIGNMMIETSGGSLALKPYVYSPSGNYYGLCQWSKKYCSGAFELPFEYQLDYLLGTMPWELSTFGWLYKENFNYEDYITMTDPAEAALAFAKTYERCDPVSYSLRQKAAEKAYEYFDLSL